LKPDQLKDYYYADLGSERFTSYMALVNIFSIHYLFFYADSMLHQQHVNQRGNRGDAKLRNDFWGLLSSSKTLISILIWMLVSW